MFSSSSINPPDAESANTRPRNRRNNNASANASAASSAESPAAPARLRPSSSFTLWNGNGAEDDRGSRGSRSNGNGNSKGSQYGGLLASGSAWVPNWSSIQEFASTLLANTSDPSPADHRSGAPQQPSSWGPAPPGERGTRPGLHDVAAGPTAARDAELRARKKATVLESHPGVNGGLDTRGKYKRRMSDDISSATAAGTSGPDVEDCLVYIHYVKPADTYFGIVLRYRCREDVFRRANGLWTRDNIQIRKWLALPVDACEIKGRPCDDPSLVSQGVDLLGTTPKRRNTLDDFHFSSPSAGSGLGQIGGTTPNKPAAGDLGEPAWTHVRWVRLESCENPVEIARISRTALGYFPPRRKKSIQSTMSPISTPRQSVDLTMGSGSVTESPIHVSRRQSLLGSRSVQGTSPVSSSGLGRSTEDARPAWMRRPGGVGSMSRNVHAPGPGRDYLNKWTTKHLPGLNIETLPSMSVLGSETAHFGFRNGEEMPGLVENALEEGRDVSSTSGQDLGLDKAAASIETWLRGAFSKRPNSPTAGGSGSSSLASRIGRLPEDTTGDLIELEDGPGEDGFGFGIGNGNTGGSGWRLDGGEGSMRGRTVRTRASRSPMTKGKKSD